MYMIHGSIIPFVIIFISHIIKEYEYMYIHEYLCRYIHMYIQMYVHIYLNFISVLFILPKIGSHLKKSAKMLCTFLRELYHINKIILSEKVGYT
jgi:hypothetical protein